MSVRPENCDPPLHKFAWTGSSAYEPPAGYPTVYCQCGRTYYEPSKPDAGIRVVASPIDHLEEQ